MRSRNRTYAIGGMGERTVEYIDMTDFVMPAGEDDAGTGMGGESAVFDARYSIHSNPILKRTPAPSEKIPIIQVHHFRR